MSMSPAPFPDVYFYFFMILVIFAAPCAGCAPCVRGAVSCDPRVLRLRFSRVVLLQRMRISRSIIFREVKKDQFCDLAYKLGNVGLRLASVVTNKDVQPFYDSQAYSGEQIGSQALAVAQVLLTKDANLRRSAAQALSLPWFRELAEKAEDSSRAGGEK